MLIDRRRSLTASRVCGCGKRHFSERVPAMMRDQVDQLRQCMCYNYPTTTRAHLRRCEFWEAAFDPYRPVTWKIHKLKASDVDWCTDVNTPWWVCQCQVGANNHHTRYRGAEWEQCIVWLAYEYGVRRKARRLLETGGGWRDGIPAQREPITIADFLQGEMQ